MSKLISSHKKLFMKRNQAYVCIFLAFNVHDYVYIYSVIIKVYKSELSM